MAGEKKTSKVERGHLQADFEAAAWRATRAAAVRAASDERERTRKRKEEAGKREPKGSAGKALMAAIEDESVDECLALLEAGGPVNPRDKYGGTALEAALGKGPAMEPVAYELARRGARVAPGRWEDGYKEFVETDAKGLPWKGAAHEASRDATLKLACSRAQSWRVLSALLDSVAPEMPRAELRAALGAQWRFDLAIESLAPGERLAPAFWSGLCERWTHLGEKPLAVGDAPGGPKLLAVLSDPAGSRLVPASAAMEMFVHAASAGDAALLAALLDGGLRPNAQWRVAMAHASASFDKSQVDSSLLVACASAPSREAFELVKAFEPALSAARAKPDKPQSLAHVPASRLAELAALGVDLSAADNDGWTFAHWWSRYDKQPRDGWATLAKMAPELLAAKDRRGRTPVDLALDNLESEKSKADFLAALARAESREIRKQAPSPGAKRRRAASRL